MCEEEEEEEGEEEEEEEEDRGETRRRRTPVVCGLGNRQAIQIFCNTPFFVTCPAIYSV